MAESVNPCEEILGFDNSRAFSAGTHSGGGAFDIDFRTVMGLRKAIEQSRKEREEALRVFAEKYLDLQLEEWQTRSIVYAMDPVPPNPFAMAYRYLTNDPKDYLKVVSGA